MRRVSAVLRTVAYNLSYPLSADSLSTNVTRYKLQQLRCYGTPASACWNCQKRSAPKQLNMICGNCGHLQDVDTSINYFDLLDFPTSFEMDSQQLTQRFRQLQALVHPDKYSQKTSREQTNSADWSSLINKAYKTLGASAERGQYMLQLHGEQMPQDNSALNKEFLMAMMERNEEVEEAADGDTLEKLKAQIDQQLQANALKLTAQFGAKDLVAVKATLVEMKYLLSIQNSIKQRLQRLLNNT